PAGLLCGFILVMAIVMAISLSSNALATGASAVCIVMAAIGITSLMSGTAATDFGGRKATATCSGIVDGFAYLGSGLQSACLGYLIPKENAGPGGQLVPIFHFHRDWQWWPIFLLSFAVMGVLV